GAPHLVGQRRRGHFFSLDRAFYASTRPARDWDGTAVGSAAWTAAGRCRILTGPRREPRGDGVYSGSLALRAATTALLAALLLTTTTGAGRADGRLGRRAVLAEPTAGPLVLARDASFFVPGQYVVVAGGRAMAGQRYV